MKNIFRIKIENLQLICSILITLMILDVNIICGKDIKLIIALIFSIGVNAYMIVSYKSIREFRKEILRRW